jgi:hypothetical protein
MGDLATKTVERIKDVTGALRARRYRRNKVNESKAGVTVTTADMAGLAGRLATERATDEDLALAGRLVIELMRRLPPDSSIDVP